MNLNISSYMKTAKNVITANSPVLLVGTAVVGTVTTAILAARAGYKARGIVDAAEAEMKLTDPQAELSTQDKAKLTWLCYAAPGVTTLSTCLAVVGVHTIHTKRANAMAAAYVVASNRLEAMTEKAEDLLGPKKTQELHDAVGQETADSNPIGPNNEIKLTGDGKELWQEGVTGRWFMSNLSAVESAVNEINRALIDDGEVPVNDFFSHIGLPPVTWLNSFGWSRGDSQTPKISARYSAVRTDEGKPANSVWFHDVPKPNLGKS